MIGKSLLVGIAAMVALPPLARAELVRADPGGIEVVHKVRVSPNATRAYAAFGQIGRWWSAEHSYSGKAAALSLALVPGGCFCEALVGGGVEHGRVLIARPGQQILMQSLLGPAATMATSGILEATFTAAKEGGTEVVMRYRIAGLSSAEVVPLGRSIDKVLGEQLARYAAFAGSARTSVTKE